VNAHPDEWLDTLDELALLGREDRADLVKKDGTIEDMEEEIQELKAEVASKAVSKGNEKRIRDLETDLQVFQEGKDKFDEALKEASATITRLRKERNEWRQAHNAAAQSKKDDAQKIQDSEDEIYVLEDGIWDQGFNPATIQVPLATPGGLTTHRGAQCILLAGNIPCTGIRKIGRTCAYPHVPAKCNPRGLL
jgi:hypothetical protein